MKKIQKSFIAHDKKQFPIKQEIVVIPIDIPKEKRITHEELLNSSINNKSKLTDFKKINCYTSGSSFGDKVVQLVAKNLGISVREVLNYEQDDLSINFGILRGSDLLIKDCMKTNRNYLYIDHAYFKGGHKQPRPAYRFTLNNLQYVGKIKDKSSKRWNNLNINIHNWRSGGKHIIVCPPTDAMINIYNNPNWLNEIIQNLRKHTDRPIIIRNKPNEVKVCLSSGYANTTKKEKVRNDNNVPLEEQLRDAHAVVTFNSSVAVEALLQGVPVFCDKKCSAINVSYSTDELDRIEYPRFEDRIPWLHHLAHQQVYIDEINTGAIWDILELR